MTCDPAVCSCTEPYIYTYKIPLYAASEFLINFVQIGGLQLSNTVCVLTLSVFFNHKIKNYAISSCGSLAATATAREGHAPPVVKVTGQIGT